MLRTEWGDFDSWHELAAHLIWGAGEQGYYFERPTSTVADYASARAERRIAQGRGIEAAFNAMIDVLSHWSYKPQ